ncbi:MAG: HNH endonuclease [Candidatus Nanoarchaeia archaeon]|nr:HNH endonuclease [Candidatus Nanoarchaeia archaeon]
MGSKYLSSLSSKDYKSLTETLLKIQNKTCFICGKEINLDIHNTNIDHIIPLVNKGKDDTENFALTHESCNKSKQDSNLNIARILYKLKNIQDEVQIKEKKGASLKNILVYYCGGKYNFKYIIKDNILSYSFPEIGINEIFNASLFKDPLSGEESCFIEAPIEYVFHDDQINPRSINSSISQLIKEFEKGNPQLQVSLARIDNNKLKVFDGQHKAVAQILLGNKRILLRIFINPNIDRLIETNTNAGSSLRQIAFDKSIMRQLNDALYHERIKRYQEAHKLKEDDFSFSEQQLVEFFRGDNANIKKYIIDSIKKSITYSENNTLKGYIDFEGKAKELPISHSTFDKTILSLFIDSKKILKTPINFRSDEGLNPRELEINQIIKILNLIAEKIYINKFKPEIGVSRIEKKIIDGKDKDITDEHLIAYRISKEEIMYNWVIYIKKVIQNYFSNTGRNFDDNNIFQEKFENQLWTNINNFLDNLINLPLWKNRSLANTIFAGKNNYEYWKTIFESGKTPDGAQILTKPLNFIEMIKPFKKSD